jgi:hypothetical protein
MQGNVGGAGPVPATMASLTTSRGARFLASAAACAALLAVVLIWFRAPGAPRPQPVASAPAQQTAARSAEPGWKTIEYRGVQLDVPSDWERLDLSECEFRSERWAPPGSPPCDFEGGAVFYGSATFDPAHGPGVRRTGANGTDAAAWAGYVYAGDFAVYARHTDRDLVQRVLDTARVRER